MLRWLLCGVAIVGTALEAQAADLGDSFLRGSNTVVAAPGGARWDGFYIGGQVGANVPGIDFTNNTPQVAAVLAGTAPITSQTTTPLGNADSTGYHYGGFVGYNTQWDGAVVGIEGTYNWVNKPLTATNGMSGNFGVPSDVLTYTAAGSVTARMIDYGTLRVRGGWAAGSFMPYATFGLAVGRMDINRTVVVTPSVTSNSPPGTVAPSPFTVTENLTNQMGYGFAAGLGIDYCLMANLFMRAEYEYVQFPDFQGLNVHMHNVRVGAALKF
jgi:outer membrane immunogenic protein